MHIFKSVVHLRVTVHALVIVLACMCKQTYMLKELLMHEQSQS